MATREELIKRAKLIQQARTIRASKANSNETEEKGAIGKAWDVLMKGADYAGGVVRTTALGGLSELFAPKKTEFIKDLKKSLDVTSTELAPSTSEYLERAGIENPWVKGLAGFAGDVALDPITYMTGGLSALTKAGKIGKAGKALLPASTVAEKLGKTLYKSAFKKLDKATNKFNKVPVSEVLWKYRIGGSPETVALKAEDLAGKLVQYRQRLYDAASKMGAKINSAETLIPARNKLAKMATNKISPLEQEIATSYFPQLQKYADISKVKPNLTVSEASSIKTELAGTMPQRVYDLTKLAPQKASEISYKATKSMADAFRKKIVKESNRVSKDLKLGTKIDKVNKELGALLTARQSMKALSEADKMKPLFSTTDSILTGMALQGFAVPLMVKKSTDIIKGGTTQFGKALHKTGWMGALDTATRRAAVSLTRPERQDNYSLTEQRPSPYAFNQPQMDTSNWQSQTSFATSR